MTKEIINDGLVTDEQVEEFLRSIVWNHTQASYTESELKLFVDGNIRNFMMWLREHRNPVDAIIHCPRCATQHVDKVETGQHWTNPPHKSHLCSNPDCFDENGVRTIFRTSLVATNGVEAIAPTAEGDNWPSQTERFGLSMIDSLGGGGVTVAETIAGLYKLNLGINQQITKLQQWALSVQNTGQRPICGVVSQSGPNREPLACGYPPHATGDHSWATLPTFPQSQDDGDWIKDIARHLNSVNLTAIEIFDVETVTVTSDRSMPTYHMNFPVVMPLNPKQSDVEHTAVSIVKSYDEFLIKRFTALVGEGDKDNIRIKREVMAYPYVVARSNFRDYHVYWESRERFTIITGE